MSAPGTPRAPSPDGGGGDVTAPRNRVEVVGLPCDREVAEGDDLAGLVLESCARADVTLRDGDVLCVAQKVVSKSEGAVIPAPAGDDPHAVRRQVAEQQAVRVVADSPWVYVVETTHGLICANAGVDASNLPDGTLALLPDDPDASARQLREALARRAGVAIGVLVTDTFGRPWRLGQTEVAIGASGVGVIRDERGAADRFGHVLEVTEAAVADELAGAADLVRRKADGTPFVLVRGAHVAGDGTARDLVRSSDEDLFRVAGPRAVLRGLTDGDVSRSAPADKLEEVAALAVATLPVDAASAVRLAPSDAGSALILQVAGGGHERGHGLEAGALLAAARIAAHTAGWTTRWDLTPDATETGPVAPEPIATEPIAPEPVEATPDGWRTLGTLRVGRPA